MQFSCLLTVDGDSDVGLLRSDHLESTDAVTNPVVGLKAPSKGPEHKGFRVHWFVGVTLGWPAAERLYQSWNS